MKKFAFKLQRILRFALLRERQKKTQIAAALQRIAFLKKYMQKLETQMKTAMQVSNQELTTLSAEAHRRSIVPTMEEMKRISGLLLEEKEHLEVKQKELVRLSQRRRSLESLREKHRMAFQQERSRQEQKDIDEAMNLLTQRRAG